MTTADMRRTGVDVVGDMPWGTHFCAFYDTTADLLETLVPYCKAGLEGDEFCLWVVAPPLTVREASQALQRAVPHFDRYVSDGSIEIVAATDWYLQDNRFDLNRVIAGWNEKLARALARGYAGVRVTGDTAWLEKNDWKDFLEYEESLNVSIANQRMAVLCTYPLHACGADEILDVVRTHQFAVTKRRGNWEIIETAGYKQAKAEIKRLNEDLERRVAERTSQLTAVNSQLMTEALERRRVEEALRRSEAGELTASVAHEIKQPITAAVLDAQTCLRWLSLNQPDVAEARDAASRMIKDVNRASDIVSRIRALFARGAPERELLDVNEIVQEMIGLLRSEASQYSISIKSDLADDLPRVMADRVHLQQLLMNLMLNGIEAMKDLGTVGTLTITSRQGHDGRLEISVDDTGVGLAPDKAEQVFQAFFTTKPHGTGMGLSISRSIVESYGGRLWARANPERRGATFQFTLPADVTAQDAAEVRAYRRPTDVGAVDAR